MLRRPARGRGNRRGIGAGGSAAAPATALTYVSAAKVLAYYRADAADITIDTGVSQWLDKHSGGYHQTQATGSKQPTFSATAGPGGARGAVTGDGTADTLANTSLQLPTPGVGKVLYWAIIKQVSWTIFETLVAAGRAAAFECGIYQATATPQLGMANTTTVNLSAGATVGAWVRMRALFQGTTDDYLKLGSAVAATGGSAGVSAPDVGLWLFSRADAASTFGNIALAELLVCTDDLTAQEISDLDTVYVPAYYGAGNVAV